MRWWRKTRPAPTAAPSQEAIAWAMGYRAHRYADAFDELAELTAEEAPAFFAGAQAALSDQARKSASSATATANPYL